MKIAVMQPYFAPYLGYFQLIHAVDRFIIFDDVNFIKRGWINRNQILVNGKAFLFSIPVKNASQNRHINEHEVVSDEEWRPKLIETIRRAYVHAPQFSQFFPLLESIIQYENVNLSSFIAHSLQSIDDFIGITTDIVPSSSSYANSDLKAQERIIDICKKEKAATYVNPPGGRELYEKADFNQIGIDLRFVKPHFNNYEQGGGPFVAGLSIIDVLMWNSRLRVGEMAKEYELVE